MSIQPQQHGYLALPHTSQALSDHPSVFHSERLELAILNDLLSALRQLTGKRYTAGDLLEYVDDTEPAKA